MVKAIHLGLLVPVLLAGAGGNDSGEYVRIERLSERVLLAYWLCRFRPSREAGAASAPAYRRTGGGTHRARIH